MTNFSCPQATAAISCPKSENMGWRYFLFTMGGIMFIMFFLRFFVFKLYESPKYLMGRGRDEEAVRAVHLVAAYNGKKSNLRLEHLQEVDAALSSSSSSRGMYSPPSEDSSSVSVPGRMSR